MITPEYMHPIQTTVNVNEKSTLAARLSSHIDRLCKMGLDMIDTHPVRVLYSVIVLGVLIQLVYSFMFRVPPFVDARAFDTIAQHLAQGLGYRFNPAGDLATDPAIGRVVGPGYPFFLAILYTFFGHRLGVVWFAQAILVGISIYCVYRLAQWALPEHRYKKVAAILAALLTAVSPDLITIGSMLLTETLALSLFLLWLVILFAQLATPTGVKRVATTFALGIIIGVSILVRTTSLLFIFPTIGALLLRKRWLETATICLLVGLCLLPWTLRNARVYHAFIPANTALGINLSAGNYPNASGEWEGLPPPAVAAITDIQDPLTQNKILTQQFTTFIYHHPLEYVKLCLKRLVIAVSAMRPSAFWFHLSKFQILLTAALSSIHIFGLFALGSFGLVKMIPMFRKLEPTERLRHGLLLAAILSILVSPVFIIAESRYRFGLYPLLAIYATYGLLMWKTGDGKKLLFVGLSYSALCLIDLLSKIPVVLSRLS